VSLLMAGEFVSCPLSVVLRHPRLNVSDENNGPQITDHGQTPNSDI